jgi:hypothetical protein
MLRGITSIIIETYLGKFFFARFASGTKAFGPESHVFLCLRIESWVDD